MKGVFIKGNQFYLRAINEEDVDTIRHWGDDYQVTRYLSRGLFPSNLELAKEQYRQMVRASNEVEMLIVDEKTGLPIGITGIHSINWVARSAEFRILMGKKEFWGKGIGSSVAQLLTAYGFQKLNLNKVWLGVADANKRAYHSYVKAGYKKEGVLRQEVYRNGKYYDAVRMSILRNEYNNKVKEWKTFELITEQFQE